MSFKTSLSLRASAAAWLLVLAGTGCCGFFGRHGEVRIEAQKDKRFMGLMQSAGSAAQTSTPSPEASATPIPAPSGFIVRPGDSFWRISRALWGSGKYYALLAGENGLEAGSKIHPGTLLKIPQESPGSSEAQATWTGTPAAAKVPTKKPTVYPFQEYIGKPRPALRRAFAPGEKLTFVVSYLGMDLGESGMEVKSVEDVDGKPCLRLEAWARTKSIFHALYPVKDRMVSWVDLQGLFPWRYEKNIHEFKYHLDEVRDYDQDGHKVYWEGHKKSQVLPPFVHDMLSSFYYYRCLEGFSSGEEISFWANTGAKNYELKVKPSGKKRVKTRAGTFDCLVIKPKALFEGFFVDKGELTIYMTDDIRRIPVKVVGKAPVLGSVVVQLVDAVLPELDKP